MQKLFKSQFEINPREVDFHIHSVAPTDLSFANAEMSSFSKYVGNQEWKMQQNESVEVALDVNDCHHRMEAGGLRECVADLLSYVVNCSESERVSTLRFLSTLHSLSALKRSADRSGEWILNGDTINECKGRLLNPNTPDE